jgi:hypothetical protein
VALNLASSQLLGDPVGNRIDQPANLVFRAYPSAQRESFSWFADPTDSPIIFEVLPY